MEKSSSKQLIGILIGIIIGLLVVIIVFFTVGTKLLTVNSTNNAVNTNSRYPQNENVDISPVVSENIEKQTQPPAQVKDTQPQQSLQTQAVQQPKPAIPDTDLALLPAPDPFFAMSVPRLKSEIVTNEKLGNEYYMIEYKFVNDDFGFDAALSYFDLVNQSEFFDLYSLIDLTGTFRHVLFLMDYVGDADPKSTVYYLDNIVDQKYKADVIIEVFYEDYSPDASLKIFYDADSFMLYDAGIVLDELPQVYSGTMYYDTNTGRLYQASGSHSDKNNSSSSIDWEYDDIRECDDPFCDNGKCSRCGGLGFEYHYGGDGDFYKSGCEGGCDEGWCRRCGGDGILGR